MLCERCSGHGARAIPSMPSSSASLPTSARRWCAATTAATREAVDVAQQVFGRAPDVVLRKQAQAGAPSTWMRLWLAPIRFEGRAVFVVQAGRPVGGRFAPRGATGIVLHDDVDEARNLLIQDMMYSGGLDKLGFVTGVGGVPDAAANDAIDGAGYYTDGLRAVLFLATRPLSLC